MLRAAGPALLTGFLVTVAGCGDGAAHRDGSSVGDRPDARSVTSGPSSRSTPAPVTLLRLKDLPRGWVSTLTPVPSLDCDADNPYTSAEASSISPLFEQGNSAAQQIVWRFSDVADAERVYESAKLRSTRTCMRRMVREQVSRRRDRELSPMTLLSQQEGRHRRRARLLAYGNTPLQTPIGEVETTAEVFTDVEVSQVGRSISLLVMLAAVRPLDANLRHRIVHLTNQRLAQSNRSGT